mgnify:CR=1 FL=1
MDKINLKGKKILVTGGNGYLGRKIIDRLISLNATVFSIDIEHNIKNPNISSFNVDLLDHNKLNEAISEINPSIIFHLAALLDRSRDFFEADKLIEVNFKGTINLLNSLQSCNYENFIFSSTSEVYEVKSGNNTLLVEDDSIVPNSPYSLSKYCAEKAIEVYSKTYLKNFTILRLFNFFGLGMSEDFFLTELVNKLLNNENFDMTFGEQKRDYLNVNDIINGMLLATNKKAYNKIFNLCSGQGNKIKDIALYLQNNINSKSEINFGALPYRKNEVWEMVGDNHKIRIELGFSPNLELDNIFKINK